MNNTKKMTLVAVLIAQAIVLHLIESLIPIPLPIPGVKLGLANIITLLALVVFDFKTALLIATMRTILGALLSGTLFNIAFFLSFSGAIASTLIMALLINIVRNDASLSLIGISIVGALAHNLGQLTIAALLIKHTGVFYYLPIMLLSSIPTGFITGYILKQLLLYLKSSGQLDNFSLKFDI